MNYDRFRFRAYLEKTQKLVPTIARMINTSLVERGFRVYMTLKTNARPVRFSFGKNAYNIIYSFAKM